MNYALPQTIQRSKYSKKNIITNINQMKALNNNMLSKKKTKGVRNK